MFIEKSNTEVITIDKEIKVVGLSLQKSSLPLSFDSLGKLWGIYGEKYRGKVKKAIEPIVEYAIALNKVPDYITGCAVTEIENMEEGWVSYIIPQGKYIKDNFNAESFYQLTTEIMGKRNVKAWAKANNIKINKEYSIEVYPIEAVKDQNVEMYTLTPIIE
ncbi:effector binding domain-containing protein [Mobilitalea sibirica]|uniref:Effector binding domain-containing protein n=1 Tax=Mobilitalea sibirica TaxID=1462919 RepID=A0A8J7KW43_9FIRM|nr:effector binding domain-containing protein [Mobilitalea sibirica]MBH1940915.1 effector binding domain-containing protein [Mobilitalea sibirica]